MFSVSRQNRNNPSKRWFPWVLGMVLLAACPPSHARGAAVRVQKVMGRVTARVEESFRLVSRGQAYGEGTEIRTSDGSEVILAWPSGHVLKLGPLSVLRLASTEPGPVRLKLSAGKVHITAQKLQASQAFQVETPELVAGVRGTFFAVDRQPQQTQVQVLAGQVSVRTAQVEQLVGPGFMLAARVGAMALTPLPLPPMQLQELKLEESRTLRLKEEWDTFAPGEDFPKEETTPWRGNEDMDREELRKELRSEGFEFEDGELREDFDKPLLDEPLKDLRTEGDLTDEKAFLMAHPELAAELKAELEGLPPHLLEAIGEDLLQEQIRNELLDQIEHTGTGVRLWVE